MRNGKMRPLGIPSYEDKLVQGVMADILNEVYEPRFLNSSYGFRPERNQHQVVRIINQTIMTRNVNFVLEADIKGFSLELAEETRGKGVAESTADQAGSGDDEDAGVNNTWPL